MQNLSYFNRFFFQIGDDGWAKEGVDDYQNEIYKSYSWSLGGSLTLQFGDFLHQCFILLWSAHNLVEGVGGLVVEAVFYLSTLPIILLLDQALLAHSNIYYNPSLYLFHLHHHTKFTPSTQQNVSPLIYRLHLALTFLKPFPFLPIMFSYFLISKCDKLHDQTHANMHGECRKRRWQAGQQVRCGVHIVCVLDTDKNIQNITHSSYNVFEKCFVGYPIPLLLLTTASQPQHETVGISVPEEALRIHIDKTHHIFNREIALQRLIHLFYCESLLLKVYKAQ